MTDPAAPRRSFGHVRAGDNSSGRLISYVFSDDSVGRDGHVIKPDAWDLANFLRNPVFLWAHDMSQPPIGRVIDISSRGRQLVGTVDYVEADVSPFADSVFQMTKRGFLNATSTSWLPIDWKYTTDRSRPGGIDFSRVELLEISQVPVPALPTALATARAAGIDTSPFLAWAERLLDLNDQAVLPRAELEALRREARMPTQKPNPGVLPAAEPPAPETAPFCQIIDLPDGRRFSVVGPRRLTDDELTQIRGHNAPSIPAGFTVQNTVPAVEPTDKRLAVEFRTLAKSARKRGLYELSMLCDLLGYADYVCRCMEMESLDEEDGSPLPMRMRAWVNEGNAILAASAQEETDENIAGSRDIEGQIDRALRKALAASGLVRAGKAISAENERCLRSAHEHMLNAADIISTVVDPSDDDQGNSGDDPTADPDDENARAVRERRARALKHKSALTGA